MPKVIHSTYSASVYGGTGSARHHSRHQGYCTEQPTVQGPHWVAIPLRDTDRKHNQENTEYDKWCEYCREKSSRQRAEGVGESCGVKWDDEEGLSKRVTGI